MRDRWSKNVDVKKIIDTFVEMVEGEFISARKRGVLNGEPVIEITVKETNDYAEDFMATYYFNVFGPVAPTKEDTFIQMGILKNFKPLFDIVEECNKGKTIDGLTYREAFKKIHSKLRKEKLEKLADDAKLKYIKYINAKIRVDSQIDEFLSI